MSLTRSPKEHLDLLHRICGEAFSAVIAQMNASHACYCRSLGLDPAPLPWQPDVRTFEQLHAAALAHSGAAYQATSRETLGELKRQLAAHEIGLPEAGNVLIELALAHSGSHAPMVVIALSPPYYPSVSNRQVLARAEADGEPAARPFLAQAGLSRALHRYAWNTWRQDYRTVDFFTGLSDLSYAIYPSDPAALAFTTKTMPLWGEIYSIPFDAIRELSLPVINIGPWGKDFHKNTERVFAPDLYERTPALIGEAIRFVFAQPNQPARFNPPDPPVPGLPGRPERPGAGSPG